MNRCPDGLTRGFGVPAHLRGSICLLKSYFGVVRGTALYRTGSGFLFRTRGSSSFVVTAGHNVFDHGSRRTAVWMSAWFGRSGDASAAQREGRDFHVSPDFVEATSPIVTDDFAVVRTSALGSDRFTPVALADATDTDPPRKLLAGYPDEGSCKGAFAPFNTIIRTSILGNSNYGYSGEATYVGMSGGPLLAKHQSTDEIQAYGIHVRGDDDERAVRLVPRVRDMIDGWT